MVTSVVNKLLLSLGKQWVTLHKRAAIPKLQECARDTRPDYTIELRLYINK